MKTYQIRYTVIANPALIKSCFNHCKPSDKKRLEDWLQDDNRKRITFRFKDGIKVQLEKELIGGKIDG